MAKDLRKRQTPAENILWEALRKKKLDGYKIRRQHPIGRYIADFYCPKARLVIEVDGSIHELENIKEYDLTRQQELESRQIKVIRFDNDDIYNNLEEVVVYIEDILKQQSV